MEADEQTRRCSLPIDDEFHNEEEQFLALVFIDLAHHRTLYIHTSKMQRVGRDVPTHSPASRLDLESSFQRTSSRRLCRIVGKTSTAISLRASRGPDIETVQVRVEPGFEGLSRLAHCHRRVENRVAAYGRHVQLKVCWMIGALY